MIRTEHEHISTIWDGVPFKVIKLIQQPLLLEPFGKVEEKPPGSVVATNVSPIFSQPTVPYCAYQVPECPQSSNPVPLPPAPHMQQRTIQKTVLLVKVAVTDCK